MEENIFSVNEYFIPIQRIISEISDERIAVSKVDEHYSTWFIKHLNELDSENNSVFHNSIKKEKFQLIEHLILKSNQWRFRYNLSEMLSKANNQQMTFLMLATISKNSQSLQALYKNPKINHLIANIISNEKECIIKLVSQRSNDKILIDDIQKFSHYSELNGLDIHEIIFRYQWRSNDEAKAEIENLFKNEYGIKMFLSDKDKKNNTILHYAVKQKNFEIAYFLIEKIIKYELTYLLYELNNDNKSFLQLASEESDYSGSKFIIDLCNLCEASHRDKQNNNLIKEILFVLYKSNILNDIERYPNCLKNIEKILTDLIEKDSDEEADTNNFDNYELQKLKNRYESFQTNQVYKSIRSKLNSDIDIFLSFIAHFLGICLLYYDKVQDRYKQLKKKLVINTNNKLIIKNQLVRKTLIGNSGYVTFDLSKARENDFIVEFLANLRLHNRDEKNRIINNDRISNCKWKVFEDKDNSKKMEIKTVNEIKSYGRDEWVDFDTNFFASYKQILFDDEIDWDFLKATRINITRKKNHAISNQLEIPTKNLSLWYLLFGCEYIRNPANTILINMYLDQMETIEDIKSNFTNLPMTEKGVLNDFMHKNTIFSKYVPHEYNYNDGRWTYENINNIVKYEANVIKKWFKKRYEVNFDEEKNVEESEINFIWNKIIDSFSAWFGDEFLSKTTSS